MKYLSLIFVSFFAVSIYAADNPQIGPKTRAAILKIAADTESLDRVSALSALAEVGDGGADAIKVYKSALADSDPVIRATALWAIGRGGNASLNVDVLKLIADSEAQVRREACNAAALLKIKVATLPFSDTDIAVRIAAAHAAAACGISGVDIASAYKMEKSARVKPHLLKALAANGSGDIAGILALALADKSPAVSGAALQIISASNGSGKFSSISPQVHKFVSGDNPVLKALAIEAAVKLDPNFKPWNNKSLVGAELNLLRRAVARSAANSKDSVVADILATMLSDKDFSVRRQASVSLLALAESGVISQGRLAAIAAGGIKRGGLSAIESLFIIGSAKLSDSLKGTDNFADSYTKGDIALTCVWLWAAGECGYAAAADKALSIFMDVKTPIDCRYQAVGVISKLRYKPAFSPMLALLLKKKKEQMMSIWVLDGGIRDKVVQTLLSEPTPEIFDKFLDVILSVEPTENIDNIKAVCAAYVRAKYKPCLEFLETSASNKRLPGDVRWVFADTVQKLSGKDLHAGMTPPKDNYGYFFIDAD